MSGLWLGALARISTWRVFAGTLAPGQRLSTGCCHTTAGARMSSSFGCMTAGSSAAPAGRPASGPACTTLAVADADSGRQRLAPEANRRQPVPAVSRRRLAPALACYTPAWRTTGSRLLVRRRPRSGWSVARNDGARRRQVTGACRRRQARCF